MPKWSSHLKSRARSLAWPRETTAYAYQRGFTTDADIDILLKNTEHNFAGLENLEVEKLSPTSPLLSATAAGIIQVILLTTFLQLSSSDCYIHVYYHLAYSGYSKLIIIYHDKLCSADHHTIGMAVKKQE